MSHQAYNFNRHINDIIKKLEILTEDLDQLNQTVLVFSACAARESGKIYIAAVTDGIGGMKEVEYTSLHYSVAASKKTYPWPDKHIVWRGCSADCKPIRTHKLIKQKLELVG